MRALSAVSTIFIFGLALLAAAGLTVAQEQPESSTPNPPTATPTSVARGTDARRPTRWGRPRSAGERLTSNRCWRRYGEYTVWGRAGRSAIAGAANCHRSSQMYANWRLLKPDSA